MAQKNMSVCRDGDRIELEIPAPGGIIEVKLELCTAFHPVSPYGIVHTKRR